MFGVASVKTYSKNTMLTCPRCQSANPPGHKFCQSCGSPLPAQIPEPISEPSAADAPQPSAQQAVQQAVQQAKTHIPLHATLLPTASAETEEHDSSDSALRLHSEAYLDQEKRYQVVTVLNEKTALVQDTKPDVRSQLQRQIANLDTPGLKQLQAIPGLPRSVYPYYLLNHSAPTVYDAWGEQDTAIAITRPVSPPISSILQSFATAADALKHVYWLYSITELWVALEALPQWRSSLLLADHLGIDSDRSVVIRDFASPSDPPPEFPQLKSFLRSLLAQPNRVTVPPHPQIRKIILTLSSATTLQQLRDDLSVIGEGLLTTPMAVTPATSPASIPTPISAHVPPMENPIPSSAQDTTEAPAETPKDTVEGIELLEDSSDSGESTMVLPMMLTDIEEAGRTDVGRQRDHNEDCFFIRSSTQKHSDNQGQRTYAHSLYVLCDGMGGHAGGEIASRLAAETLFNYFAEHWPHPLPNQPITPLPSEETISTAIRLANQAIFDVNQTENRVGPERMGTTLVMALIQGTEAAVAHVGDSRLYTYARRAGLRQVTTDHEVGQREIQRGIPHDIAYARPDAYQLTQALGPRDNEGLEPSVSYITFSEDTLLLLCSDGLSDNNLVETYLESNIDPLLRGKNNLDIGVDELMTLANEVNGHDNISAIAIRAKVSPDLSKLKDTPKPDRGITVLQ